ncbi:hypothetical protein LX32DRAFT_637386 [Colletotrichum zoysiae]|uniref:Uncharacterized protein n=1 Tax=Colletotrichum zoysiae TaxID=1216348 RepID=A0AAD9M6Z1_9PEZI|nr:hypothetical protein LX32DRAFT_637386 [Colletotrichum zoysiae]
MPATPPPMQKLAYRFPPHSAHARTGGTETSSRNLHHPPVCRTGPDPCPPPPPVLSCAGSEVLCLDLSPPSQVG